MYSTRLFEIHVSSTRGSAFAFALVGKKFCRLASWSQPWPTVYTWHAMLSAGFPAEGDPTGAPMSVTREPNRLCPPPQSLSIKL